ncbi:MAG: pentapeptide repeat-containing protein [Anaerolineae bacterium]
MNADELLSLYESGQRSFEGTDLAMEDLRGATLAGASFAGAQLMMVNLSEADLSQADLTDVDLRWANLNNAVVSGEQLDQVADLTGATLPDGSVHR